MSIRCLDKRIGSWLARRKAGLRNDNSIGYRPQIRSAQAQWLRTTLGPRYQRPTIMTITTMNAITLQMASKGALLGLQ
ncbi:hypothetical protein DBV39_14375 [Orrella marina]|uniref:Uncharacterized protein n=1 Tax=Orrella marina TaxID=2163011 RepID=A0A2R4XLN3_9BURK|nr:hypothetical protein DBV39_14375 [Orrella marina]